MKLNDLHQITNVKGDSNYGQQFADFSVYEDNKQYCYHNYFKNKKELRFAIKDAFINNSMSLSEKRLTGKYPNYEIIRI